MTFKAKLLWGIFAITTPLLLALILNRMAIMDRVVYNREMDRVTSMGKIMVDEISDDITDRDTVDLKKLLSVVVREPSIVVISVLDYDSIVRFSTSPGLVGRKKPFPDSPDIRKSDSVFYKSFALPKVPRFAALLQIGYSVQNAKRDMRNSFYWAFLLDTGMLAITLTFAWILSSVLTSPLYRLREAANHIAKGDFSVRVPVRSKDEIGQLAHSVNDMANCLEDLTQNMQHRIDSATRELTMANIRLQELNKIKSDFVAMVSHEFRSPLTTIVGYAQTLLRLKLPETDRKEFLGIIEQEGNRLARLVEEYLDISRMESGDVRLYITPFQLDHLIQETVSQLPPNQKHMVTVSAKKPIKVSADRERIKRVLKNLIDNAIKYGGPKPEITVELLESLAGPVVSISDNGPGIPEDVKASIFDPFYRGPTAVDSKIAGSGLGLAIAKTIVEAHMGEIWCDSWPGKGSRFSFVLPRSNEDLSSGSETDIDRR